MAVVAGLIPWQQSVSYPTLHMPLRSVLPELLVRVAAVALAARVAIPVAIFRALQRQPVVRVEGVCRRIRVLEMGLMGRVAKLRAQATITAEMVLLG